MLTTLKKRHAPVDGCAGIGDCTDACPYRKRAAEHRANPDRARKQVADAVAGQRQPTPPPAGAKCIHLGDAIRDAEGHAETVECGSCKEKGGVFKLKTFACAVHGKCTQDKRVPGVACCDAVCPDRCFTKPAPKAERPRVLFASHELERTGAPIHLANVVGALRGFSGRVWSPIDGPLAELYREGGMECSQTLDLAVDLVVANSLPAVPAVAAAKAASIPCVWLIHESDPEMCHNLLDVLAVLDYPETVIFPSKATAAAWAKYRADAMRVVQSVIPPVPLRDRATAREQLAIDPDAFVVLTMGRDEPRKGQADIRAAIGGLCNGEPHANGMPGVKYVQVAGDDDPWSYYAAADVYVCSSRIEAFPLAIQEAAAYGLPIITTPVFGCAEMIRDGINGIHYQSGDIQGLRVALAKVRTGDRFRPLDHLTTFDDMLAEYEAIFRAAACIDPPHVVYHVAGMGDHWKQIVTEQLGQLADAGLTEVMATHVGKEPDWLIGEAKRLGVHLTLCSHDDDAGLSERPAIRLIERLVQADDRPVLYLHSKGVSHSLAEPIWGEWRRLMMRETVAKWRENLKAMRDHDAIGVNWWQESPHFSGNFWLASAAWLRQLPRIDFVWRDRYSPERWIGMVPGCRAKSLLCEGKKFWAEDRDLLFELCRCEPLPIAARL